MSATHPMPSGAVGTTVSHRERPWYVTVLRNRRLVIGGLLLLAVLLVAVLAQGLATHNPLLVRPEIRLTPPNAEHRFGTDNFGRDLYSRTVYGARISQRDQFRGQENDLKGIEENRFPHGPW